VAATVKGGRAWRGISKAYFPPDEEGAAAFDAEACLFAHRGATTQAASGLKALGSSRLCLSAHIAASNGAFGTRERAWLDFWNGICRSGGTGRRLGRMAAGCAPVWWQQVFCYSTFDAADAAFVKPV